jgi:hypothetical protein
MTIDSGFYHTEMAGLTRFAKLGPRFPSRPGKPAVRYFKSGFVWLPALLIAGLAGWTLLAGHSGNPKERIPVRLAAAVAVAPGPASASPARDIAPNAFSLNPVITPQDASTPQEASAPVEAAAVDGLKISSQSWRRGGLGSKALVTFTLRNSNDYAVKDIAIACAFTRRDGSHLTDRTRMIPGTVSTRSRKTFARQLVGFVNVNADKAKCSLVAASRI